MKKTQMSICPQLPPAKLLLRNHVSLVVYNQTLSIPAGAGFRNISTTAAQPQSEAIKTYISLEELQ